MVDGVQNLSVSDTFYPDWWNVNTHRCNHINRTPLFQANYGMGRALFANWGRVGGVKAQRNGNEIKLIPQISTKLVKKLHHCVLPTPLLSPIYATSMLPYTKSAAQTAFFDNTFVATSTQNESDDTALMGNEFTTDWLLNDPIAGDHAAAGLLCGKMHVRFRRNRITTDLDATQSDESLSSVTSYLQKLEHFASEGGLCDSAADQDAVLQKIRQLVNPQSKSMGENDNESIVLDNALNEAMAVSPERHSKLPKRSRTVTVKRIKPTKKMASKQFIENLVRFEDSSTDPGFVHSHWLTGLDPLLIRLASRPVNPVFQGNGLLCKVRHNASGTHANGSFPILLWSPPKPPDFAQDCPNALFFSNCSPMQLHQDRQMGCINLPSELPGSARLCELDAIQATTDSQLSILTRWTGMSCTDNIALYQLRTSESDFALQYVLAHSFRPSLPSRGSTLCFNPWLPDEWAIAGNHVSHSGDRLAFLHAYTTDNTKPIWSGHMILDDPGETVNGMNRACSGASGFTDVRDTVNDNVIDTLEPAARFNARFSVFTDGLRIAPFDHFLRVGYGSNPSQLSLTTSQRMFLVDIRQASIAQSLFQFRNGDPALESLFHMNDRFTCVAPNFLEDVFILAGTSYNMILLDKRMPFRPVLHWAHSLFGEPTYLDWTAPNVALRTEYDLPQLFVTACAQNPLDLSFVGLNLGSSPGPQLVGPEFTGSPLTKIFTGAQNDLPTQLVTNKTVSQRLQSTYCGLATSIFPSATSPSEYLGCITLTGAGDLFMHSWHFTMASMTESLEDYSQRCRDWLSDLRCNLVPDAHIETSRNSDAVRFEVDLTEIDRLDASEPAERNPNCQYWSFMHLTPAEDFQSNSTVFRSSQELLNDLSSFWNGEQTGSSGPPVVGHLTRARVEEEQMRRSELDSCTEAAKNRISRFTHILKELTEGVSDSKESNINGILPFNPDTDESLSDYDD